MSWESDGALQWSECELNGVPELLGLIWQHSRQQEDSAVCWCRSGSSVGLRQALRQHGKNITWGEWFPSKLETGCTSHLVPACGSFRKLGRPFLYPK